MLGPAFGGRVVMRLGTEFGDHAEDASVRVFGPEQRLAARVERKTRKPACSWPANPG